MPISNPYLTHIHQKISSTLWSLKEDERSNSYNNSNQINLPTPLLDGFFDLYLNTYGYSSVEFVNLFKTNERNELPELMFGQHYSFMGSRKSWLELFTPSLSENLHFFKLCFANCLKHVNVENISYSHQDAQIIYENNKELFTSLITIGKKSDFFSKMSEDELYTHNVEYQSILIDSQIFENNFSVKKLTDFLTESVSIDHRKSTRTLTPFVSTYLGDIVKLAETQPQFLNDLTESNLLREFLSLLLDIEKPSVNIDNFMNFLLKDSSVSSLLVEEDSQSLIKKIFLNNSSHLLTFFENLSIANKHHVFGNLDFEHSFSSRSYSYSGSLLNKILTLSFDNENRYLSKSFTTETLNYLFGQLHNYNPTKLKEVDSYIGNFILSYATCSKNSYGSSTERIEAPFFEQSKAFFHLIPSVFSMKSTKLRNSEEDYKKMGYFLTLLKEKDIVLYEKVSPKIYNNLKDLVYNYLNPLSQNNNSYDINAFMPNLCHFLSTATPNDIEDKFSILDILNSDFENPAWNNINRLSYTVARTTSSKNHKNNKTIYKEDYNFAYYLIEATKGKALSWFIQPSNLEHFSKIKYKGKGFISYFQEETWFKKTLVTFSENKEAFKELVLNVKPAIKVLEVMATQPEHSDIKTIIDFYKLDTKIKNKDEEVIVKRVKI